MSIKVFDKKLLYRTGGLLAVLTALLFATPVNADISQNDISVSQDEILTSGEGGQYLGTNISADITEGSIVYECISFHAGQCGRHAAVINSYPTYQDFLDDTNQTTAVAEVNMDEAQETTLGNHVATFDFATTTLDPTKHYVLSVRCTATCAGTDNWLGSSDNTHQGLAYSAGVLTSSKTISPTTADYNFILNGVTQSALNSPSPTEDYVIITDPTGEPAQLGYSDTITIEANNVTNTYATSTVIVSFISQTGISYNQIQFVTATSSQTSRTESVTFTQDDIIYARAYLYNGSSTNAANLIDVSPEYEFWVTANANASEPIDLGSFRGDASLCTYSTTSTQVIAGLGFALCSVGKALFYPSIDSLDYISGKFATATGTAPFSYIWDVNSYIETLFSVPSTSWEISVPSTTPYIGDITLISSSELDSNTNYQTIRSFISIMLYLSLVMYVYFRVKRIARTL
jgi:hypothetical protein